MISINDVTVSYGSFTLLDDLNFHIGETDKIGLVGKYGAVKSTLMKLITGEQSPTSGHIAMPSDIRIGYLPQIMEHHRGRKVIEEVMTVFEHLHEMERELERINGELAERTDYESDAYSKLINRLNEINDRLALETGESPRVQAEKTLFGLGFKPDELDRLTETFSQGWNMRIELAKVLLAHPDVLLLDEPTNHLDIESIEWFEDYLKAFRGSLLLVSHDRKFLDNVTTRTVEILLGHINDYKVPYSQYVTLRAERIAQQTAAYENQQRMIEKTEDFINRFRYKPTKSNQVQSRIKALEKLDRIEIDETDDAKLNLRFPPAQRSGDVDEGWSEHLDLDRPREAVNVPGVIKYAKEKGVGVILWAAWAPLIDREARLRIFDRYAAMGAKGFKVDFMNRDDQQLERFLEETASDAAERKLVIMYHGIHKPTGLCRTFPNVLNYEGVYGLEQGHSIGGRKVVTANDVNLVFTRMVAGAMDYTPGAMRNRAFDAPEFRRGTDPNACYGTRCHQLALFPLFEAPVQMLCDSPTQYRTAPECTAFLTKVPTVWDETRGVAGEIGQYAAVARRKGREWWLGAITNWDARTLSLPTDFLGGGEWQVEVFEDAPDANLNAEHYARRTLKIKAGESIKATLAQGGGFAARFSPAFPGR